LLWMRSEAHPSWDGHPQKLLHDQARVKAREPAWPRTRKSPGALRCRPETERRVLRRLTPHVFPSGKIFSASQRAAFGPSMLGRKFAAAGSAKKTACLVLKKEEVPCAPDPYRGVLPSQ